MVMRNHSKIPEPRHRPLAPVLGFPSPGGKRGACKSLLQQGQAAGGTAPVPPAAMVGSDGIGESWWITRC